MKEQILEGLFDSPIKFRLLRFFIRNQDGFFQVSEIAKKIRINAGSVKKHIEKLGGLGFLVQKSQKGKKSYGLDKRFVFYSELKNLIFKSSPVDPKRLLLMIKNLGRVSLAIVSGIFINQDNSRIDLLLVGNVKPRKLSDFMRKIEAEAGSEIKYSAMVKKEFDYRYDMYDKFIRDILDYRHEKLINKLKI